MNKKLGTKNWIELVLLVIALLSWLLRKMKVLYIPALGSFALGIDLGLLGIEYIGDQRRGRKVAGVLILAFGLLNVFLGVMELYSAINGI